MKANSMFHGQKKGVQHESTGDGGTRGRRREVEEVSTAPVSTSLKRWREPYDLLISSPVPRLSQCFHMPPTSHGYNNCLLNMV